MIFIRAFTAALFSFFILPSALYAASFPVKVTAPHDVVLPSVAVYKDERGEPVMPPYMTDSEGVAMIPSLHMPFTVHFGTHGMSCPEAPHVKPMKARTFTSGDELVYRMTVPQKQWDDFAWAAYVERDQLSSKEIGIVRELNRHRRRHGFAPVTVTQRLNYVIGRHLRYLEDHRVDFEGPLSPHCTLEGHRVASTVKISGVQVKNGATGENLGKARTASFSAVELVDLWKESESHNSFMLRPDLTSVGVGVTNNYFGLNGFSGECVDKDESERDACELSSHDFVTLSPPKSCAACGFKYRLQVNIRKKKQRFTIKRTRFYSDNCAGKCGRAFKVQMFRSAKLSIRAYRREPYRKVLRCFKRNRAVICRIKLRKMQPKRFVDRDLSRLDLDGLGAVTKVVVLLIM